MGLPASQIRVLAKIENAVQASDPRLTSQFAIFNRLSRGEQMPGVEQVPARPRHQRGTRRPSWLGATLFCALAVVALASTFIMAAASSGSSRCPAGPACAAQPGANHRPGPGGQELIPGR